MNRLAVGLTSFLLTVCVYAGTGTNSKTGNPVGLTGSATTNNCVKFADTSGNLADSGSTCGGAGTVTTTGTPANGNLTKFSGATSITNGDLSGDCTTSGALAITCTKTNSVAFGTSATVNTGTSGATIPLLNGANTYSGASTFSAAMTNSANGAASVPAYLLSGTILTGGTATTNFPNLFLQPTGTTAVTTWSTSGTGLGMNLASGFAGNFLDFHVAGGATLFSVSSVGTVTSAAAVTANTSLGFAGSSSSGALKNAFSNKILCSATAPTIGSGFGTSPSIPANNGSCAFTVNVGTGGSASSGVVTMAAATTGYICNVTPAAAPQAGAEMFAVATSTTSITITNYTASTGVALAWPASAVLNVMCLGY